MRYQLCLLFLCFHVFVSGQGFLKADGTELKDSRKQPVILRGMGLGGWMLQEPYMMTLSGVAQTQTDIRNKITTLIGRKDTETFYADWLNNHCTKADIDSLAAWGFNSVRLPMHYNLYTLPVEKEPVAGKNTWLKKGFDMTDSLLSWCKANKIYLILDLHAAPGGQGNDIAISDRDTSLPSLWQSEANQQKTIALWTQLARRYKNEPWIGGYDIINEPNWGFESANDKNGAAEKTNIPLKKLLKDITAAIRKIDKNHVIIIEGNCWGNNYNGIFPLWDDNMMVSFHKYWNYTDQASIQNFLDYRERYKFPIWLGETGENSNAWFTGVVALLEKNKIGWCMWPLKKSGLNNILQVRTNKEYQQVLDYWRGNGDKPSREIALKAFTQLAADTRVENNIFHPDVADAMMRQVQSDKAVPFKPHVAKVNEIVFATDYDMGRSGVAYHDKDSAEYWVQTQKRTPWNTGGKYRNDGVDIEACADNTNNGYNVGWVETGEWLQYTVLSEQDGVFDINVRNSAKDAGGVLQLLVNNQPSGEPASIASTGKFDQWQTTTIRNIRLSKGSNSIRVLAVNGGFNLNYLQFISASTAAMVK